eukprot:jgi/Mesvir1/9855/Mv22391-RA.1
MAVRSRGKLTRQICYIIFIVGNICWFGGTVLFAGRMRPSSSVNEITNVANTMDDVTFRGGVLRTDAELLAASGTPTKASKDLLTSADPHTVATDMTVTNALTAGFLKLSSNILATAPGSGGKLLLSADTVSVGTSLLDPHDKLVVNGPIRISDGGTQPACVSARRGMIWHHFGGTSKSDVVSVCIKNKLEEYEWINVAGGDGSGTIGGGLFGSGSSGGGLSRQFLVASDESIHAGDVVSFIEGQVTLGFGIHFSTPTVFLEGQGFGAGGSTSPKRRVGLVGLSSTRFVLLHGGSSGPAIVQIGNVEGTTLHVPPKARSPFGSDKVEHFATAALSKKAFVVAYSEPSKREACSLLVAEVVLDGIPGLGTPVVLEEQGCSGLSIASLSSHRFVVVFNRHAKDGRGRGTPCAVVGSVHSNRRVELGNVTEIGEHLDGFSVAGLAEDRFVLAFRNLKARTAALLVGQVHASEDGSSLSISLGEEVTVHNSGARVLTYLLMAKLSPVRIAVGYADNTEGYVVLLESIGGSLAVGPPIQFSATKPLSVSMTPMSPMTMMIAFYTSNPWRAMAVKLEVSLQGLADGQGGVSLTESQLSPHYSTHTHVAALDDRTFVASYYDGGNSDAGTLLLGSLGRGMGVASTSAKKGEEVSVVFSGVSSSHSDLHIGACYYAQADGRLSALPTHHHVGLAISATELLLHGCQ